MILFENLHSILLVFSSLISQMTQEPMINDDSSKDLYDDNDQFQQDEPFWGEEEEDFYADTAHSFPTRRSSDLV